jgi:PAS domain-containing protein
VPSYETWRQTIHPDDRENVEKKVQEAALKGNELNAEWRVVDRDGSIRWLMSRGRPLLDANGKAIRFIGIVLDITERKQFEAEREKLIKELQYALDNVKTLQGLIPICASCKKIRDDKGFWNQVEGYISQHTDAKFTHGICPDCAKKLYGDVYDKMIEDQKKNNI